MEIGKPIHDYKTQLFPHTGNKTCPLMSSDDEWPTPRHFFLLLSLSSPGVGTVWS